MSRNPTMEVLVTPAARDSALIEDVRSGLLANPKSIPPVWFYDETGSILFDEITRLPEYYLTRAESCILEAHAAEIVDLVGATTLVEVGSGTSEKTRILLDAMAAAGSLSGITLLDISEEVLLDAARILTDRYDVNVHAVVGDLRTDLPKLPRGDRQLWAFLGSTIGNFAPEERRHLLSDFRITMGPEDHLLLGTDLIKDPQRLVAAYDDGAGVTAAFNRNVLKVLNTALHADFAVEAFEHRAVWNPEASRIEMRLRSEVDQDVRLEKLDVDLSLAAGEEILTEISSKFDASRVVDEFATSGLEVRSAWTDPNGDFLLSLLRPGS